MKIPEANQGLVVNKTIHLKADSQKVWNALTKPELTKKYFFGCEIHSELHVGSTITWTGTYHGKPVEVKGEIIRIEPGKLLMYTAYSKESGLEDIPSNYTKVTERISDEDDETILTVTDENFGNTESSVQRYKKSEKGWDVVLKGLKELVER